MRRLLVAAAAAGVLATVAGAFLISNSLVGSRYVFESVPANRRPLDFLVDTEPVTGVGDPLSVAQQLTGQWNAVAEAEAPFGVISAGGPYNGATAGTTFGTFTDSQHEMAWDDTGEILSHFGLGGNVLGITLKSVDTSRGQILDVLVIVNTQPFALVAPGTGATAEELFRGTLLHELGHAVGLGHTPVGIVNPTTFGLGVMAPSQMPTMFPFRLPQEPQEGGTLEGDDTVGLTGIYPDDTSGLGSISGTVRGVSGAGVNEIAVRAIGPAGAGEAHVGILTNADAMGEGAFTIANLPPGPYRVLIEAVNGRANVTGTTMSSNGTSLGANPFVFAIDEFWQPGDTYDPAEDERTAFELVYVHAGRDTGSLDFVLNGEPLLAGPPVAGTLASGDAQLPDGGGGFHFVDYFVFAGTSGQQVTIDAQGSGVTPQLSLLRPSDLDLVAEDRPLVGSTASIALSLPQTGVYTLAVHARATTGNPGGTGSYTLTLAGASGTLPPPPVVAPASVTVGASDPGALAFSSPVCATPLFQVRIAAPSHEELWVDEITLRASGTGDDALDVTEVALLHDVDGDGRRDLAEPVLATGTFAADDGTLTFTGLDRTLLPGEEMTLLVLYAVTVQSVTSAPQTAALPWWLLMALALPLLHRKTRAAAGLCLLLALPLVVPACGGGGGGCNGTFDPSGAIATFRVSVAPGDVGALATTTDPASPLPLPATTLGSGTLSVSN